MKKFIALSLVLGFSFKAFGYGAAGCGVGSLIFDGKNEWYEQTLAATSNTVFLGNQTFGITFGTLNCDANKLNISSEKAKVFVAANKNSVMNELAFGQGETVSVLASIYNCETGDFGKMMKSNYSKVILKENLSSEQIVENMDSILAETKICSPKLG